MPNIRFIDVQYLPGGHSLGLTKSERDGWRCRLFNSPTIGSSGFPVSDRRISASASRVNHQNDA